MVLVVLEEIVKHMNEHMKEQYECMNKVYCLNSQYRLLLMLKKWCQIRVDKSCIVTVSDSGLMAQWAGGIAVHPYNGGAQTPWNIDTVD